MQLFSGRGNKEQKKRCEGRSKCQQATDTTMDGTTRHRGGGKCRALCCGGSRLSVSSSASQCSSADAPRPRDQLLPPRPRGLSKLAHGMAQERLRSMIDDAAAEAPHRRVLPTERHRRPCEWGAREAAVRPRPACVVLLAEDRRTYEPLEEFRRSIAEVIAAKRMAEPAELRALLNCYVSVNAREHRAAILEAFHEVCSALFSCK